MLNIFTYNCIVDFLFMLIFLVEFMSISSIYIENESRIVSYLLENSITIEKNGLFHGKMGIVLFFAIYGQKKRERAYQDFSQTLLDNIWENIDNDIPVNLASGLAGIGWGIEYLIQNGFVSGDIQEICADIDKAIMEFDSALISDYSIKTGITGIIFYVLSRIKGNTLQNAKRPFNEKYLSHLFDKATYIYYYKNDPEMKWIAGQFIKYIIENKLDYTLDISPFIEKKEIPESNISFNDLGLNKGVTGKILLQCL